MSTAVNFERTYLVPTQKGSKLMNIENWILLCSKFRIHREFIFIRKDWTAYSLSHFYFYWKIWVQFIYLCVIFFAWFVKFLSIAWSSLNLITVTFSFMNLHTFNWLYIAKNTSWNKSQFSVNYYHKLQSPITNI